MALTLSAAQIHWAESYKEAEMLSKKEHKPIYLFISAAECPWCEKLEKTTLKDEKVIKLLNEKFIPLHLVRDFDTIPKRFRVRTVPRHYIEFKEKNYFYEDIGYFPVDIFLLMLNTTLNEIKEKK
jgi:thioredoxin-related protein